MPGSIQANHREAKVQVVEDHVRRGSVAVIARSSTVNESAPREVVIFLMVAGSHRRGWTAGRVLRSPTYSSPRHSSATEILSLYWWEDTPVQAEVVSVVVVLRLPEEGEAAHVVSSPPPKVRPIQRRRARTTQDRRAQDASGEQPPGCSAAPMSSARSSST